MKKVIHLMDVQLSFNFSAVPNVPNGKGYRLHCLNYKLCIKTGFSTLVKDDAMNSRKVMF